MIEDYPGDEPIPKECVVGGIHKSHPVSRGVRSYIVQKGSLDLTPYRDEKIYFYVDKIINRGHTLHNLATKVCATLLAGCFAWVWVKS